MGYQHLRMLKFTLDDPPKDRAPVEQAKATSSIRGDGAPHPSIELVASSPDLQSDDYIITIYMQLLI
jgi:hypothetical protein